MRRHCLENVNWWHEREREWSEGIIIFHAKFWRGNQSIIRNIKARVIEEGFLQWLNFLTENFPHMRSHFSLIKEHFYRFFFQVNLNWKSSFFHNWEKRSDSNDRRDERREESRCERQIGAGNVSRSEYFQLKQGYEIQILEKYLICNSLFFNPSHWITKIICSRFKSIQPSRFVVIEILFVVYYSNHH